MEYRAMNVKHYRIHGHSWIASALMGIAFLTAGVPSETAFSREARVDWNADSGRATLTNGDLELVVETRHGINARSLRDVNSGLILADRDYQWSEGGFPEMKNAPKIKRHHDGDIAVTFTGRLGAIDVEQTFALPKNEPGVLIEEVAIRNPANGPVITADFKCGFAKCIRQRDRWVSDADKIRVSPVPYRRDIDGRIQESRLREVAERGGTFAGYLERPQPTPVCGAEGWVWTSLRGKLTTSFLLAKYNQQDMEWSLLEPVKRGTETVLRFGGAGQWKHGHPSGSSQLASGKSYCFGQTRIQVVAGDWKQAFYAYSSYIEAKGCRVPKTYNPPLHWNELYDNEYFGRMCGLLRQNLKPGGEVVKPDFWKKDTELLKQYYTRDMMLAEAAKAKDVGCEALYLDPGWDVHMCRHIWDAARLGPMDSFVAKMRNEYGLKVSVWCNLGNAPPMFGDYEACPVEAQCVDKNGNRTELFCFSSPSFVETKERRMLELCRQGGAFMMFDSDNYYAPCYDKSHGHSIPLTWDDHAKGVLEVIHRLKRKYPNVLIEMHDPCGFHYTPAYYGYDPPKSFDCLWGHEFMWMTREDLLTRRAVSLYYYNLAYSIPIYLHINIKEENENALLFWWFASTCRHLGMGGKPGPAAWDALKKAMHIYKPLKKFYTQGQFYGIDEMIHVHTLPDLRASVVNVFNLTDKRVKKEVRLRAADIGLPAGPIHIEGDTVSAQGDEVTVKVTIPARGHQLLKVKAE
jgi:hypothetical protein